MVMAEVVLDLVVLLAKTALSTITLLLSLKTD